MTWDASMALRLVLMIWIIVHEFRWGIVMEDRWKVKKVCEAFRKLLPEGAERRTFLIFRKKKWWIEMSQPKILIEGLADTCLSTHVRLTLVEQGYGLTGKRGEPIHGEQASYLCRNIFKENGHQHRKCRAIWWRMGGTATSATSMICYSMWTK